jgi:para-nitrobenzyl esterase
MVWIHGGSNTSGYSQEADYRGARLAARGAVVVTVNYRMGPLGFFAHPAVPDVSAGRQGLSDQITALRWVRQNIAAFGGDPSRVTLFGESAGGTDIAALMHIPAAKGLFARAIIESGYLAAEAMATPAAATLATASLFTHDETAAMLAQRSARALVTLQAERRKGEFVAPLVSSKLAFRVPLLIGSNADEYRLYLPADPAARAAGEASILRATAKPRKYCHACRTIRPSAPICWQAPPNFIARRLQWPRPVPQRTWVHGFTDSTGSAPGNMALGRITARKSLMFLAPPRHGCPPNRLTVRCRTS